MNVYTLRIHELPGVSRQRIVDFCQSIDGSVFCVREEEAQRPHYQAVVRTSIKSQAFRVRVTNAFKECKGNSGYSIKTGDDYDGFVQYLCKGASRDDVPDVVYVQDITITRDVIAAKHEAYWQRNKELRTRVKKDRKAFDEELLERCRPLVASDANELDARSVIANEYLIMKRETGASSVDVYRARQTVNAVWLQLHPGAHRALLNEINSRL